MVFPDKENEEEQAAEDAEAEVKVVALETIADVAGSQEADANQEVGATAVDPAPEDDAETAVMDEMASPIAEEAAPASSEEEGDGESTAATDSAFPDLMDIFESEDIIEPTITIPGLETLTMNEIAAETDNVVEELRSRFLS